jgi:hypothetical protein
MHCLIPALFTLLFSSIPLLAGDKSPPILTAVGHKPEQPRSGEMVTVTAATAVTLKSLELEYQIVEPGKYIPYPDRGYSSGWIPMAMEKFHSDKVFSAQIPASVQTHRRLVRYRFKGVTGDSKTFIHPATPTPESDLSPNFAYFVYDGIPSWKAAAHPAVQNGKLSKVVEFPSSAMGQVHPYFLIAKAQDVGNSTWFQRSMDKEYRYSGTLVAHGRVYDHINFRARGGEWRYAMGKNMWKFDFHKDNRLEPRDDYDRPYKTKWSKLNLRACIQQGDYHRRGEQGMFEAVGFRLFNLAGVDAPRTHWISLRIVEGAEENPTDQYKGDFWGLYLAIENEDGRFLEEHDLPDGNVFKMKFGTGELANNGEGQPTDLSDLMQLLQRFNRRADANWWSQNVNLPLYYSYRSILESIHHYDVDAGKNYTFYFNPQSRKWHVIPWDIDLSWGDHMFGWGREPFMRPVLSEPAFRIAYDNRQREIRDLLFNEEQTGQLIDECAAIISHPKHPGALSIVDADRAKWDYHPIMNSRHVNSSKAGHGLFYESSPTGDFAGMVQGMKDYVRQRSQWIDERLVNDPAIPEKPKVQRVGKSLVFQTSAFAGSGRFAALKWRVAEVDAQRDFSKKPSGPGHYEITPKWESAELSTFQMQITIPKDILDAGHIYRVRARMKDQTARWSHWSEPVQFVAE